MIVDLADNSMKLTKCQLRLLIENTLNDSDKTDPKAGQANMEKTEPDPDMHIQRALGSRTEEDDIHAITDYRKGGSRDSFPPIGFGDLEGINTISQAMHEPDLADVAAVDKYRLEKNIGDREVSAFDDEYTNPYGFEKSYKPKSNSNSIDYDYSKNYDLDSNTEDVETFEDEKGKELIWVVKKLHLMP